MKQHFPAYLVLKSHAKHMFSFEGVGITQVYETSTNIYPFDQTFVQQILVLE